MVQRIIALRREGKSCREIAREVGAHYTTVASYVRSYQPAGVRGEPPPPRAVGEVLDRTDVDGTVEVLRMDRPATVEELMRACKLDPRIWIPQYFKPNIWQGYGKIKGKDGERFEKVNLFQSKLCLKRILAEEVEAAILDFVREHVKPLPRPAAGRPRVGDGDAPGFLVCWGLWDTHLGMYAWNSEVGASFDVNIARRRILNSIDDMVTELRPYKVDRIVMPVGNDFMHFDSVRQTTAFGHHFLDTDTRFAKVFRIGVECLCYMVDRAREVAGRVDVLYVPGNHDTTSSYALCSVLEARYREDPAVRVDLGANPRKYVTHGGVLLGFDHGGDARPGQLALVFAQEAREHWSKSTYREVQVGHTHQRRERAYEGVVPNNGVLVRTNPALCNNDMWHHRQALVGEPMKSVEAWRYDAVGYRGSHVTWARDEREEGGRA